MSYKKSNNYYYNNTRKHEGLFSLKCVTLSIWSDSPHQWNGCTHLENVFVEAALWSLIILQGGSICQPQPSCPVISQTHLKEPWGEVRALNAIGFLKSFPFPLELFNFFAVLFADHIDLNPKPNKSKPNKASQLLFLAKQPSAEVQIGICCWCWGGWMQLCSSEGDFCQTLKDESKKPQFCFHCSFVLSYTTFSVTSPNIYSHVQKLKATPG